MCRYAICGVVTAGGLAQGIDFPANVAPFILPGVTLVGINSVMRPIEDRLAAWQCLADILDHEVFDDISIDISLAEVVKVAKDLISSKVQG